MVLSLVLLLLAPPPETLYEVTASSDAKVLSVDVRFPAGFSGDLKLDDGFLSAVEGLEREKGGVFEEAKPSLAPPCPAEGCHLRYRVKLGDSTGDRRRHSGARTVDGVVVAQPGAWLLRPENVPSGARFRLRVTTPPGIRFETGIFPSAEGAYAGLLDDLDDAPYSAFGNFDEALVSVPGGTIVVAISPGEKAVSREEILSWVQASGSSVAGYFGRFPMPRALVLVLITGRRAIGFGTTMGNGGGSIMVSVGSQARVSELHDDWVLTHEMTHLALPDLMPHHWFEEGVATYVEPLARAQAGILDPATVWKGLKDGLPKGLPEAGDEGLDRTHTWGRTYWGGALFCFIADVEIRERTKNTKSLQDALRGPFEKGANLAVHWEIDKFLAEADRATGVKVLSELYARWAFKPVSVDLDALFGRLGVRDGPKGLLLDDTASLAEMRRGFTAPRGKAPQAP
jgi:hypothetical protein